MSLILEGLPRSLDTINLIYRINNYMTKSFIYNINSTRQRFINHNKIIFSWNHTRGCYNVIHATLFLIHRFLRIIRRVQFNCMKTP